MKFVVAVILFQLCFGALALDIMSFKNMAANTKRNSPFTPECQAGALKLDLDSEYQKEESARMCYQPEAVPNKQHEYVIVCQSPHAWSVACKSAGGSVCGLSASVYGRYGGDSNEDATYNWQADICVPEGCKKGNNLDSYKSYFINFVCPLAGLRNCKMDVACKTNSRAGVVVGIIFGVAAGIALIGALSYVAYTRYQASPTTGRPSSDAAPFVEYSELAQYEKEDDPFISDTSGIDGEEDHPIN